MPATERPSCDLVMKGGITSGVVYPGAVIELAKTYRFRNIGGTSAGAIAAGVAAAAEYGRQRSGSDELPGLADAARQVGQPGFVRGVFQPTPGARPVFAALLSLGGRERSRGRRAAGAAAALLRRCWWPAAAAAAIWAALLVLAVVSIDALRSSGALALAAVLGAGVSVLLLAVGVGGVLWLAASRLGRSLNEHGYGMCPGAELTEWLHERIQASAGLGPDDPPLTFRALEEQDVRFEAMTTDLSLSRPVRLPLEDGQQTYLFDPAEMSALFPEPVVRALAGPGAGPTAYLPGKDMPVVVAIRMSLSFPLLLSAIRLYTPHPTLPTVIESWMSDGGISSNFPIHFFDSWLPGHPTFGLDLQPFPGEDIEKDAPEVYMPASPEDPQYPHWTKVAGVGGFVRQIADVMENWRDTLQSELPGFRDRICQVRLREDEGGLNLDMDDEQIEALLERGRKAGVEIGRKFDWRQHRFARYLTFMQMMETGLRGAGERFDAFEPDLAAGVPGVEAYRAGHDANWFAAADRASRDLFATAAGWGPPPAEVGFDRGYEPKPTPVMRITPRA